MMIPQIPESRFIQVVSKLESIWDLKTTDMPAITVGWKKPSSTYLKMYSQIRRTTKYDPRGTTLKPSSLHSSKAYKASLLIELSNAVKDIEAMKLGFSNLPILNVGGMHGTYEAMLFGCKFIDSGHGLPWTIPIIDEAKDVYNLRELDIEEEIFPRFKEKIEYFLKATKGQIMIKANPQVTPFETIRHLWDFTKWIKAIYKYPDEVHYLLNILTDLYIKFNILMRETTGDLGISVYPTRLAATGAFDYMSPMMLSKFVKPYYERIAKALGPVTVQGHLSFEGIRVLLSMEGVRGLEYTPTSMRLLPELSKILMGKGVLLMGNKWYGALPWNPTPFGTMTRKYLDHSHVNTHHLGPLKNWKALADEMHGKTGLVMRVFGNTRDKATVFGEKLLGRMKASKALKNEL